MPRFSPIDWYQTPLWYDIVFDSDTDREADFIEAAVRAHATGPGRGKRSLRLFEPACGTGRLVVELARRGHRISGSDVVPAMLDFARRRLDEAGLRANLRCQDMARLDPDRDPQAGRFDAAFCLVSTFKYLLSDRRAVAHLRGVGGMLRPGGVYLLGLHLSDYAVDRGDRERWVARREGMEVVCNIKGWPADPRTRREAVRARITATGPGERVQRFETHWTFRTYNLPQLRRVLRAVPELEPVANYGFDCGGDLEASHTLDSGRLDHILVLRKQRAGESTGRSEDA